MAAHRAELEPLLRVVERMAHKGCRYDVIERVVAGWVREHGVDQGQVAALLRTGLVRQLRPGPGALESISRRVRRAAREPLDLAPLPTPSPVPMARRRDEAWFHHLQATAAPTRWAMSALEPTQRFERPSRNLAGVRTFDEVTAGAETWGAIITRAHTVIPATHSPGVYALQMHVNDAPVVARGAPIGDVLGRLRGGTTLPIAVRHWLAARFAAIGRVVDLDHVLIHVGAEADALCRMMRADAFALGRHVVFRAEAYRPDSPEGLALLAHELTHVWQQAAGKVEGRGVVDDPALERDADRVAMLVLEPAAPAEEAEARASRGALGGDGAAGALQANDEREDPGSPLQRAPRASTRDALVREARETLRAAGIVPAAVFVVSDRIDVFDAEMRLLGTWRITGDVPLAAGYWYDGGVAVEGWSNMKRSDVERLTGGDADDLWVVGAQYGGA